MEYRIFVGFIYYHIPHFIVERIIWVVSLVEIFVTFKIFDMNQNSILSTFVEI